MLADNGHQARADRVELKDKVVVEAPVQQVKSGASHPAHYEFEVVGIIEDAASAQHFAVCYSETIDEFIVTDEHGRLVSDDALAQDILTDFLEQASDSAGEDPSA